MFCISRQLMRITDHLIDIIGDNAFYYCSSLTQVVLTDGLTVLGAFMFYMSKDFTLLPSIIVPSSLISIGKCYCYRCNGCD